VVKTIRAEADSGAAPMIGSWSISSRMIPGRRFEVRGDDMLELRPGCECSARIYRRPRLRRDDLHVSFAATVRRRGFVGSLPIAVETSRHVRTVPSHRSTSIPP
jgi:hypothetical protein